MVRRRTWTHTEKKILIENYETKTAKELETLLPGRSRESINNKIKRLKSKGKISEGKDEEAIQRAYEQRGKDISIEAVK
jgi:hypothetical protein